MAPTPQVDGGMIRPPSGDFWGYTPQGGRLVKRAMCNKVPPGCEGKGASGRRGAIFGILDPITVVIDRDCKGRMNEIRLYGFSCQKRDLVKT